jgi:hypothetical protein
MISIFLARGLHPHTVPTPTEEEGLRVERVPLLTIPSLIDAGQIRDGKTLIGLMLAMRALGRTARGESPAGA